MNAPAGIRQPMYRCVNGPISDHFYTMTFMPNGTYGYGYEGVAFYSP